MRDPKKKGNLAYEAGFSAADSLRDRDDAIDLNDQLDYENVIDGFCDRMDEIVDMDAEDRRDA